MSSFTRQVDLPVDTAAAFQWHARPGALERLTPPWEHVEVVEPGALEDGARAHLRMKIGPLHTNWIAEHRDVVAGARFSDVQIEGPFASWTHEHRFEDTHDDPAAKSRLVDHVKYLLPLGGLGSAGEGPIEGRLDRMFRYRHDVLRHDLEQHARHSELPLTIGVTGASGLVGSALAPYLTTGGHTVRQLPRRPEQRDLEGLDAVVHLAGEPLVGLRWTKEKKRRIYESRAEGTRHLAALMASLDDGPRVLVSMSGINYYGDRGSDPLTEESERGEGFLADVCRAWEEGTKPAADAGIRVVTLRTGVVLSASGGALPKLALPFKLGFGGRLGRAGSYLSYLTLDDLLDVILRSLTDDTLSGPLNAVTDAPVTQRELSRSLARVLWRPNLVPVPPFLLKAAVGSEMAEEVLLSSQRVVPEKLRRLGHTFRHRSIDDALRHVLGRTA